MCQRTPSLWNPADWPYVAEGGKHALFRYSGNDHNHNFSGHLLRIAKSELADASASHADEGTAEPAPSHACDAIDFPGESESPSRMFHTKIVRPLLGSRYLDLARPIRLPASFCAQIFRRALASGSIPPSRLPSWAISGAKGPCVDVRATLLRDHTQLSRHPRLSSTSKPTILSVEIKPKAGYISTSPLVLPNHRCKYYRTRYSLQQELIRMGHARKGWRRTKGEGGKQSTESSNMHDAFTTSNYSPLDLFSSNIVQIRKALQDLSQNMQNNFRVWCDGRPLFGEYTTPSDSVCQKILDDIFHHSGTGEIVRIHDPISTTLDVIIRTVSRVLERESLLSNILSMQRLDVIDGDGAVKIYERLLDLCEGSNVEAEKLLDDAVLVARDGFVSREGYPTAGSHVSLDPSPYIMYECESLNNMLHLITHFETHHEKQKQEGSSLSEEIMDDLHAECIECVNSLSKKACVYLLQNWLLSLALCDVSFFVSFQFLMHHEHDVMEECQTCGHGGIVSCFMPNDALASHSMAVHYEVKVIDCDPKPSKKLLRRREVEGKFKYIPPVRR